MNRIQNNITELTDAAVTGRTIEVPIIFLFKVSEDLNRLYDTFVEQGVISETEQEKEQRVQQYSSAQLEILTGLKALAQAARPPKPKVVEVADPGQGGGGQIQRRPTPQSLPLVPVVDETEEMEEDK
jgi:hypothetical protein